MLSLVKRKCECPKCQARNRIETEALLASVFNAEETREIALAVTRDFPADAIDRLILGYDRAHDYEEDDGA